MKLKMIEPGMERFSGNFGGFEFVDGVSLEDIPKNDIIRLGAIISVVDAENPESQQSQGQLEMSVWDKSAEVITYQTLADEGAENGGIILPVVEVPAVAKSATTYTRESLQAIADEKGIKGLREIGAVYGVKGTAIVDLIEGVLAAQGGAAQVDDSEIEEDLAAE